MNGSSSSQTPRAYSIVVSRQPQKANAEVRWARSVRRHPSEREMTLEPPTPKRFEIAERNMKAGVQTVTALTIASLPVRPIKNVSAML